MVHAQQWEQPLSVKFSNLEMKSLCLECSVWLQGIFNVQAVILCCLWFFFLLCRILMAGILPFGAMFIELFFIFSVSI